MRRLPVLILSVACVGLTTGVALAQSGRVTDMAYVQGGRCVGLMSSKNLGDSDSGGFKAWLAQQSAGRPNYILDKADEAQQQAKRLADRADGGSKADLIQERDGKCSALKG